MHAHCGILRERTLRAAAAGFGHSPDDGLQRRADGGVAVDLAPDGARQLRDLLGEIGAMLPAAGGTSYDNTASLQDRTVSTGIPQSPHWRASSEPAARWDVATGRAFDARRAIAYPPYDVLRFDVPVLDAGDVNARVWIRIREIEQSVAARWSSRFWTACRRARCGCARAETAAPGACEGLGFAEGFRGDVLAWLRP